MTFSPDCSSARHASRVAADSAGALRANAMLLALILIGWTSSAVPIVAQQVWSKTGYWPRPSFRMNHAMVYDSARARAVMFGGLAPASYPFMSDETWELKPGGWQQVALTGWRPRGRESLALAYDARRQRVVLFGGSTIPNASLNDTWEFDGTTWKQIAVQTSPPARSRHALAYDAARGVVLLFGGYTYPGVYHGDTWVYDGNDWRQLNPINSPAPRASMGMAYDSRRARVVLQSGVSALGRYPDTWEWDGTNWVQVVTSGLFRTGAPMVYDESRGLMHLYGGGSPSPDVWEYEGGKWQWRNPTGNAPPPLTGHASCYDPERRKVLVFGGWDGIENGIYDDVWEYGPVSQGRYDSYAPSCRGGAAQDPLLGRASVDPYVGDSFDIRLEQVLPNTFGLLVIGVSNTSWNGIPLPLELSWFGMPGCRLATSYEWSVNGWSDASGVMQWGFAIPQDAGLVGARFYNQAFALDASAHQRPLVLSNACAGVIGAK